jgi:hypothetical protein
MQEKSMAEKFSLMALVLASGVLISACDESKNSSATADTFVAEISGAVTGRVSGPGLIRFLPPSDANFGPRPGYFFVADDSGVRELGITFTIPANTQPGTYQLVSAHPMDAGKEFEVRVDWSVGNRTESFQANTEGTITIEAFPNDGNNVAGRRVTGSFDFSTQDRNAREITAKGSFDFYGR